MNIPKAILLIALLTTGIWLYTHVSLVIAPGFTSIASTLQHAADSAAKTR